MRAQDERKHLDRVIQKYLDGKASPSEKAFVEAYYGYFEGKPSEMLFSDAEGEAAQRAAEERLLARLKERLDAAPGLGAAATVHRLPFYRRRVSRITAAAALVLLAAGAWWLYRQTGVTSAPPAPTAKVDVLPGGNHATLTLANGRTVILDSAADGSLASQGQSMVVKMGNGQLAYVAGAKTGAKIAAAEPLYNTLATPIGGQYKVKLPDGTVVWLNSASSIRYPTVFTGKERHVEVTGEAYFEIKEDAHMPFTVDARGIAIAVLGTHFNVMAYADEPTINTTLVEGKVRVTAGTESAILHMGEQAQTGNGIVIKTVDTDKETAWTNGFFEFDQTDLPTLMRQLRRWYGIEPVYEREGNGRLFGGRISRGLNLSQVLKLLEGNGIHFTIEGKKLIILNH